MAGDGNSRWIVLLNKSPKGPLSEEEIRALLKQGIVRRNDIAYRIPPEGDNKAQTEWKLLWQFPEFDRRADQPAAVAAESTAERRILEPAVEATRKALTEIPPDLLNIAPEDLLPKSTGLALSVDREPSEMSEAPVEPRPTFADFEKLSRNRWIFGTAGVLVTAVILYIALPSMKPGAAALSTDALPPGYNERMPASPPASRANMVVPTPTSSSRLPIASRRMPEDAPIPPRYEPEVLEADQGEVAEEDALADAESTDDGEPVQDSMRAAKNPRDRPNMGARRNVGSMKLPKVKIQNDDDGVEDTAAGVDVEYPPDGEE
jgi:hypothetical protein